MSLSTGCTILACLELLLLSILLWTKQAITSILITQNVLQIWKKKIRKLFGNAPMIVIGLFISLVCALPFVKGRSPFLVQLREILKFLTYWLSQGCFPFIWTPSNHSSFMHISKFIQCWRRGKPIQGISSVRQLNGGCRKFWGKKQYVFSFAVIKNLKLSFFLLLLFVQPVFSEVVEVNWA